VAQGHQVETLIGKSRLQASNFTYWGPPPPPPSVPGTPVPPSSQSRPQPVKARACTCLPPAAACARAARAAHAKSRLLRRRPIVRKGAAGAAGPGVVRVPGRRAAAAAAGRVLKLVALGRLSVALRQKLADQRLHGLQPGPDHDGRRGRRRSAHLGAHRLRLGHLLVRLAGARRAARRPRPPGASGPGSAAHLAGPDRTANTSPLRSHSCRPQHCRLSSPRKDAPHVNASTCRLRHFRG